MDTSEHIRLLQLTYAAQLADAVVQLDRAGVLEQVTDERRVMRHATGAARAAQLGIAGPAAAFTRSAELFGCADWVIVPDGSHEPEVQARSGAVSNGSASAAPPSESPAPAQSAAPAKSAAPAEPPSPAESSAPAEPPTPGQSAAPADLADFDRTAGHSGPAFVATAGRCLLAAMVKKAGGPSPCRLYCLDPIEGMVSSMSPGTVLEVEETLYDGGQCRVRVSSERVPVEPRDSDRSDRS